MNLPEPHIESCMTTPDLTAPVRPCTSLAEARSEIDSVDLQIVALLRQRRGLVHQVYAFASRGDDQQPTDRFLALLRQRRQWAETASLDPKLVETIFTLVVNTFTAEELAARKPKP
jgi:chorismate mutase